MTVVTVAGAVVPTSDVFEAATTTFSLRSPSSSLVSESSARAGATESAVAATPASMTSSFVRVLIRAPSRA